MLKKQNRLSTEDLKGFHKGTKTVSVSEENTLIDLRYSTKPEGNIRFGVSCSKKICKTAIDRNRLRRVVYGIIDKNIEKIKYGTDGLFSIKKYDGDEVVTKKIITRLLQKANLVINDK